MGTQDWNWFGIIQSTAALITMIIAWVALNTWKKQQNAEHITTYLDNLSTSLHALIQSTFIPFEKIKIMQTEINNYIELSISEGSSTREGLKNFITHRGNDYGMSLSENLNISNKLIADINTNLVKGEIYSLKDNANIKINCENVVKKVNALRAIASMLSLRNVNLENEQAMLTMSLLEHINAENQIIEIKSFEDEFIKIVKEIYTKNYHTIEA